MNASSNPLLRLDGVGPQVAAKLARIGIAGPRDLLFHLPFRYQDRTRIARIGELELGQDAVVLGQVELADIEYRRRRSLLVIVSDQTSSMILRFFHFSAAQQRAFQRGAWIKCYGEVRQGRQSWEMVHPEYRLYSERPPDAAEAALTPVYPGTEGVSAGLLRKLVAQVLDNELGDLRECLPATVREKFQLPPIQDALQTVHRPPPDADTEALLAGTHPAQRRLATEELLAHHLALSRFRQKHKTRRAPVFNGGGDGAGTVNAGRAGTVTTGGDTVNAGATVTAGGDSWRKLQTQLGFQLTAAQRRVIGEVLADLQTAAPAMRLIQGDVGCGKTVVAAAAALRAIDSGYQAALMAPTELLSEQHRRTFGDWFAPLNLSVEWLGGRMPAAARAQALRRIACGDAQLVIGTHALFQEKVAFHRLGLLIIDEQHRFGVDQRLALRNKAGGDGGDSTGGNSESTVARHAPHQLIMSATPIPRSLAMIFYADLDISNIDQMPPGRKPVQTVALPNSRRADVAQRIRRVCRDRQQAYWVCPLIEESDKLQAQAATETFDALTAQLPELRIELIHGRMKSADKEAIMRRFHGGDIDLLVATTVIEVGVDVPAASLMIIENAERLGLAQLHQLRGRVGRGAQQAACVLMYQPPLGANAKQRLGILRDTGDGFVIAGKDLELRGPGELLGTKQTGLQQMKVADLARDRALLPTIEAIAKALRAHADGAAAADAIIRRWVSARESYAEV
ncbi:MAG: ATP-dependent DNA helicase RecG [Gammaproteobacteria bacterium]|nr:ATP-dependent DNA helicase RecG [Gammaproteobacteria bacterium]